MPQRAKTYALLLSANLSYDLSKIVTRLPYIYGTVLFNMYSSYRIVVYVLFLHVERSVYGCVTCITVRGD